MIELVKYKDTWYIRNGMRRTNCVCDRITRKQLATLHRKIGKVLGIKDWKKAMEEDKKKFIN